MKYIVYMAFSYRIFTASEKFRFLITGGLATLLHYGIYYVLLLLCVNMSLAFAAGYFLSFVFNYLMSARFTFKKKTTAKNGIGFIFAHCMNFLLQIGLLNFFAYLGVGKALAPIPAYSISIPVNFLVVRFVFRRTK